MLNTSMKACSKCNTEKPLTEFHKRKNSKDGYNWNCKICVNKYFQNKKSNYNWDYKICGIYQIIDNDTTECLYVGKSIQFNHRKNEHQYLINNPTKTTQKSKIKLYNNLKQHSNISILLIKEYSKDILLERERYYIKKLKPKYNEPL